MAGQDSTQKLVIVQCVGKIFTEIATEKTWFGPSPTGWQDLISFYHAKTTENSVTTRHLSRADGWTPGCHCLNAKLLLSYLRFTQGTVLPYRGEKRLSDEVLAGEIDTTTFFQTRGQENILLFSNEDITSIALVDKMRVNKLNDNLNFLSDRLATKRY